MFFAVQQVIFDLEKGFDSAFRDRFRQIVDDIAGFVQVGNKVCPYPPPAQTDADRQFPEPLRG